VVEIVDESDKVIGVSTSMALAAGVIAATGDASPSR
jgi:hypothetical protein